MICKNLRWDALMLCCLLFCFLPLSTQGVQGKNSHDMLVSKMFQMALKPVELKPYHMEMLNEPAKGDITIATFVTLERLPRVVLSCERHKGPMSVAITVNTTQKEEALKQLAEIRANNPFFAQHADVHLLVDNNDLQRNLLRNIARLYARTPLILQLDADFLPCNNKLSYWVNRIPDWLLLRVRRRQAVLVVPALELNQTKHPDPSEYPTNKKELLPLWKKEEATLFQIKYFSPSHAATNASLWIDASTPYQISYREYYEPYLVMRREGLPWCDERFVGFGFNKISCIWEIYLSGTEFWVLPQFFIMHIPHEYPEETRLANVNGNRELWKQYRYETCFRYGFYSGTKTDPICEAYKNIVMLPKPSPKAIKKLPPIPRMQKRKPS